MDELQYQADLLRATNNKLVAENDMYSVVLEHSTNAFLFFDLTKNKCTTFGNWDNYFPFHVSTVREIDQLIEYFDSDDETVIRSFFFPEKFEKKSDRLVLGKSTSKRWIECLVSVNYDSAGRVLNKIFGFHDVTSFKVNAEELEYMAHYDITTGLYNRNYFVQQVNKLLDKAKENNDTLSIMFLDIDDFKSVNDGLGMLVGDELLQVFGQYVKGLCEEGTVLASHFTSDIFCIAILNPVGPRSVEQIYRKIRERCEQPFDLTENISLNISVSVGVAEYPEAEEDILRLISFAEIVMFRAKKSGRNAIQYFNHEILTEFLRTVELGEKLKVAISAEAFDIRYQPQFNVITGELRGVEALARLKNPDGSLCSIGEYIPVAEKNGSIITIGAWVMKESMKAFAKLREQYKTDFILSLNISAIQFKRVSFVGELLDCIQKYDIPPELIELELTESVMIDDFRETKEKMEVLKDYGIGFSLDDFGTGYSSLSYLAGLPIDTLKIDKSFVDHVLDDEASKLVMEAIIVISQKLELETIAEGVETDEQRKYLRDIGCDVIQGYLLGKPMSVEGLEEVLKNR